MFLDEDRDCISIFNFFLFIKSKNGYLRFHSNLRISEEKNVAPERRC